MACRVLAEKERIILFGLIIILSGLHYQSSRITDSVFFSVLSHVASLGCLQLVQHHIPSSLSGSMMYSRLYVWLINQRRCMPWRYFSCARGSIRASAPFIALVGCFLWLVQSPPNLTRLLLSALTWRCKSVCIHSWQSMAEVRPRWLVLFARSDHADALGNDNCIGIINKGLYTALHLDSKPALDTMNIVRVSFSYRYMVSVQWCRIKCRCGT